MSAVFFIEFALKSAIVSGATLLILGLLKRRSAAQRSWLAHAGLAVLLVFPLGSLALPSWSLGILSDIAPSTAAGFGLTGGAPLVPASAPALRGPDWPMLLTVSYVAGAGLFLLLVVISILRLFALRARSAVLVDANWLTALARAQRRMDVKYGAALLVNDEVRSPLSWGVLRPTILLNAGVVPLHADAEAIIAHELAHVVRLDWAKLLASKVATALFWFNPLVWMLARQCHQLREEAADDAVLRSDVPSEDYAALLIGAARHECKGALLAAHGVAPRRDSLKQRITRVLDEDLPRGPTATAWAVVCLVGGLLLAGPLSAFTLQRPMATQPVPPRPANAGPSAAIIDQKTRAAEVGRSSSSVAQAGPSPRRAAAIGHARPASQATSRVEDGSSPPYDPLAPDFGERIAGLAGGTADTRRLTLPTEAEFAAAGYPGLHERQKTVLTAMGVTPAYMREMASAGYDDLSVDDLVDLKRSGVSADLVRKLQKPGERRLTPGDLVAARER